MYVEFKNLIMNDPMDIYSIPVSKRRGKLADVFYMPPRRNRKKPGRELVVTYDSRHPLVKKFKLRYSYFVHFFKKKAIAGDHYHNKKEELFIPIKGNFTILLKDIKTNSRQNISINSKEFPVLHIRKKIAHKVISRSKDSVLLVMATYPGSFEDEHSYIIK